MHNDRISPDFINFDLGINTLIDDVLQQVRGVFRQILSILRKVREPYYAA